MNKLFVIGLTLCIQFIYLTQTHADIYTIEAIPAWVKQYDEISDLEKNEVQLDHQLIALVNDEQFDLRSEEFKHYSNRLYKVTNLEDVDELGTFNFSIDPDYERLIIHELKVFRDGKFEDRISRTQIKVLQQEDELQYQVYNGYRTVSLLIPDIQVGDLLSIKKSTVGNNPIMENHFFHELYTRWSIPIKKFRARLLTEPSKEISFKALGTKLSVVKNNESDHTEYLWSDENISPVIDEKQTPEWWEETQDIIQISTAKTWHDIAKWGADLYEIDSQNTSPELQQIAQDIKNNHASAEERLIAALRFVQQDIRYVAILIGKGGYIPRNPELTLANRYGDCKDKTLLLRSLLAELGIQSSPALVHTENGERLNQLLPSRSVFDHVILKTELNGKTYWLDGTMTYQRGNLDHLSKLDFGYALVLSPHTTKLEKMYVQESQPNFQKEIDEYFVVDEPGQSTHLKVTTIFRGDEAAKIRARIARNKSSLEKSYFEYYEEFYQNVSASQPIVVKDNEETDELTLIENYTITDPWMIDEGSRYHYLWFPSNYLKGYLDTPSPKARQTPIEVDFPTHVSHTIRAKLPDAPEWWEKIDQINKVERNKFVTATRNVDYVDGIFQIGSTLKTHKKTILASDAGSYHASIENIDELFDAEYLYNDPASYDEITSWKDNALLKTGLAYTVMPLFLLITSPILFIFSWLFKTPLFRKNAQNQSAVTTSGKSSHSKISKALISLIILNMFTAVIYLLFLLGGIKVLSPNHLSEHVYIFWFEIILFTLSAHTFFFWKMSHVQILQSPTAQQIKPVSAILWYFVPVFWFWKPYKVMEIIFDGLRISEADRLVLKLWWAGFWGMIIVGFVFSVSQTLDISQVANASIENASYLIEIVWYVIAIKLIKLVTDAREKLDEKELERTDPIDAPQTN